MLLDGAMREWKLNCKYLSMGIAIGFLLMISHLSLSILVHTD